MSPLLIFLLGLFLGIFGTMGVAALLMPRPEDYPDLEHVPPHLRSVFIDARRVR